MKKKKLSILVSGPLPPPLGGMETYCQDYLKTNIPTDFDITFCRCTLIKQIHEAKGFLGVAIRFLNRLLTLIVWLYMLIVKRPDIVHVHTNSGFGFYARGLMALLAERCGAKAILHMHGAEFKEFYNSMSQSRKERTIRFLNANSILVVLSQEWLKFFVSIGISPDKIVVETNSVFLPEIVEDKIINNKLTVLYLSRIEKRKGVYELIDCIKNNPEIQNKFSFVIAGPKTHGFDEIHEMVESFGLSNFVTLPGPLVSEEKDAAYRNADLYVLQSFAEGMPIGLLEAMSYGLVCITTPVGGIPDVIHHRENGFLIPPGDPKALAETLQMIGSNSDLRNYVSKQARKTIEQKYNWKNRANALSELYLKLVEA